MMSYRCQLDLYSVYDTKRVRGRKPMNTRGTCVQSAAAKRCSRSASEEK